ncbi:hypothetical protein KGQ20_07470 [Catenulispora sp. NF23]|uniref:WD40 repeat domain-containing protein n=1 Tax=Catenulispora pinistramenti TaxID=2705254 RepID=A0ABS5KJF4_9ACTN|nr:hypothetical protein [Catenulispora pinistramenti]MBS2532609.1 hypothetical protein [Catenulispora pinistramenti]MBS2546283.1 hypothetical protein [Catenulispora pinistramenti]
MVTEQDLREALADVVEDPAADALTLGLSDRALAEAGTGTYWRRAMTGKRGKLVPGIAIGSAFVVAAAVGVAALGGGSGGGSTISTVVVPNTSADPVGQSALTEFGAECFNGHGPKLALSYVWDPATRQYRAVPGDVSTSFQASPDGKQALVQKGLSQMSQSWAAGDWSAAVAGQLTPHPIADAFGMLWTTDGKEVVTQLAWDSAGKSQAIVVKNKTADFYDPASGRRLASVPIPPQVLAMAASRQWSVQQWQGDHDSVLFPLLRSDGKQLVFLNAQGATVRTLTFEDGLPATMLNQSEAAEVAAISPDGRYLAEFDNGQVATFDLNAGGKRIGIMGGWMSSYNGWTGDNQIVTATDESRSTGSQKAPGHSPLYRVLSPELKVMQETRFVLPSDPNGNCSTWPTTWAPKAQFPGAFVP